MIEPRFDEDQSGTDRLWIFGDERTLLGKCSTGEQQDTDENGTTFQNGSS